MPQQALPFSPSPCRGHPSKRSQVTSPGVRPYNEPEPGVCGCGVDRHWGRGGVGQRIWGGIFVGRCWRGNAAWYRALVVWLRAVGLRGCV